jgi:hypothetical protein
MPLVNFMTQTASTKRHPAMASGKIDAAVTNLTNLKICPLMLPSATGQHAIRELTGFNGANVQFWETYTESHDHTDSSVSVTQLPDIVQGDLLVVGSTTYVVEWIEQQPATSSFGATLLIYVYEDKTR